MSASPVSSRVKWLIRAVAFTAFVGVWQLIGSMTNPVILSTPINVVMKLMELIQGGTAGGTIIGYNFWSATALTLRDMAIGYIVSVVIGVPLGLLIGLNDTLERALDPYVNALYVTPRAALIPLVIIWFGISDLGDIIIVILSSIFPIIINATAGVKNIDISYMDTCRAFGVAGLARFRRVVLPGALPYVMAGLRIGLGQAFIGVMVAEMLLSVKGLGYLLTTFGDYFMTPYLLAIVIELAAIGIMLTELVKYVERRTSYLTR